ncbi:MAG: hypothetical protein GTN82_04440, partial [Candidatus Aminicenantes bacterium]|nr:hypothetical protein [Candidatus Aminicenantes bacterium]NIO79851.1 hypothetical protein [Candidatus Aminicenantes bacterium]NIQ65816.1 hypothetical protein [Candidatus Aminicenantes bacterium]NIR04652.1 hypothetical protein [Candidatus Aminicenantes bacterium]NIT21803.1 hypothetical protein [Candidatus Aminicenantes bacterium]
GGVIGNAVDYGITVNPGTPNPIVTVYGTNFKVDGVALPPSATEFTPLPDDSVLTVTYTDEAGNPIGEPVNLLFD